MYRTRLIAAAIALSPFLSNGHVSLAQKGNSKPGSGGGGTNVSYTIVQLAEADGLVTAINNSGHAVGWIEMDAGSQPVIWMPSIDGGYDGMPLLSTLAHHEGAITFGFPADISDSGMIAGGLTRPENGLANSVPVVWLTAASQPKVPVI